RSHIGRRWDASSSPAIAVLVQHYEADWRASPARRPDPALYLPTDPAVRPSALLALLRADLMLRWRAQEPCSLERYRDRFPELDNESLAALLYEEYCLREEAGEQPEAADYRKRFPEVADYFREVLEIHEIFGRTGALSSRGPDRGGAPFPEAGQ